MRYHGICSNFGFWPWWLTSNCFLPSETGKHHDMREFIWMEYGIFNDRRKFRSQTSDNMDGWKSRGGKSQRREEQKRGDLRRERVRGKKMQVREKVAKSRNTMFFQWFVAPEGRKVGSLKRRCGAIWPDERWKIARHCGAKHISKSKCTKHLMFGALLEVDMSKKKVDAVVARSTFRSQNVQSTSCSEHFWKLRCRKSVRCCGAKHLSKSKCAKHTSFGALLGVEMSKKCTPLWREAYFEVNMLEAPHVRTTFGRSDVISCGRREGLCTLSKVSETWGFCSTFNYNYITPHYITLITLHYTTLHSATLH